MQYWLTRDDLALQTTTIKRFEPSHWTVAFPRGAMASVVSVPGESELTLDATFLRRGDLIGLVFESEDRHVHVGHRRETSRNYSRCQLSFRWQSSGTVPLDAINGPTLTIEGEDASGDQRSWYVRLWNYASGESHDALISLDFDHLDAGFLLPQEAERVDPQKIDRMFISLVPPMYEEASDAFLDPPHNATVTLSDIACTGSGSVVSINDAFVPEHGMRICTAYDDLYHLTPERVFDEVERLGYRKVINHYVGMSHYPALRGDGLVDATQAMCVPARRWHESFASLAAARGYDLIWSASFELPDEICPASWKQRNWAGHPALTGYSPPSTLLSPASTPAMEYLGSVLSAFADIGASAGLTTPMIQIGEPWWWTNADDSICLYDDSAKELWGTGHVELRNIKEASTADARSLLDTAGRVLSDATAGILSHCRHKHPNLVSLVLPYLPSIIRHDAPELVRANLPLGWMKPAFDILQLEDYEWASSGWIRKSRAGLEYASARLGYSASECQYLAGFVAGPELTSDWQNIIAAAERARESRFSEVFIWALPQVLRDGLTIFEGEEKMRAFKDVSFPLQISVGATVATQFSTTIAQGDSGYEFRNVNWQQAVQRYDVGPAVRSKADVETLLKFFRSVRGNAIAFRFRDPLDHSTNGMTEAPGSGDVLLGVGDGKRRLFPLIKRYEDGEVRRVTRPVPGTIRVFVDGASAADWALNDLGVIELPYAPSVGSEIRASFLFDVPVRFEEPSITVSNDRHLSGKTISVPLIEVREA